jgi:hypothetical protein
MTNATVSDKKTGLNIQFYRKYIGSNAYGQRFGDAKAWQAGGSEWSPGRSGFCFCLPVLAIGQGAAAPR